MASPLSKTSAPKTPPLAGVSGEATPPAAKPAAAAEPSWAPAKHAIGPARGLTLGEATAAQAGDALPSSFPLHDLSEIKTTSRAGAGFRLDGGALRLMWMNARRIHEQKEGKGFELSFFAHAGTIGMLEHRLKEREAVAGKLVYATRELDPNALPDAQVLVSDKNTWGPSAAKSLRLEQEGKFSIELVTDKPEALKGAVRLRVFGDDKTATKTLQQLVSQLGLQHLFAPPKPADLERFKLHRVLWHFAPERLEKLKFQSPLAVSEKNFDQALANAGASDADPLAKAIDAAKLDEPQLDEYLRLLRTFAEREPKAFLTWAESRVSASLGLLPPPYGPSNNDDLRATLKTKGLDLSVAPLTAAAAKPISEVDARRLLDFGLLLAKDAEAAKRLLRADVDDSSVERLRTLVAESDFGADEKRLENLRFEEVYPGYFTVTDPSLPERLAELGARYLYSTAESAERVLDMLTEGQKSSATRFSEGRLVQGKSSDADFNSGGAFSVFSRLVTDSAIEKKLSFGDWSGSRPYKIVISRDVLARLDWYGYNSDNFGRSTNLTAAHHGEKLIQTIQGNYGGGNELMFPVGNAPAFFDFVVCANDGDRKKLLELLEKQGITSMNGRPVETFVRTEKTFFEHPRDQTLERAVAATVGKLNLSEPLKDLETELAQLANANLEVWVKASAQSALSKETPSLVPEIAEKAARGSADVAAAKVTLSTPQSEGLKSLETKVKALSLEAAEKTIEPLTTPEALQLPASPVEKTIRSKGKVAAEKAAAALVSPLIEAATKAALSEIPKGTSDESKKQLLKEALEATTMTPALEKTSSAINLAAREAAFDAVRTSIKHRLTKGVGKQVRTAAESAALQAAESAALQSGLLAAIESEIAKAIQKPATLAAEKALTSSFKQKLNRRLNEAAKAALVDRLSEHGPPMIATFTKKAGALAKPAGLEAATSFASAKGAPITAAETTEALSVIEARLSDRVAKDSKQVIERVVSTLNKTNVNAVVQTVIDESLGGLVGNGAADAAAIVALPAAHQAASRILKQRFLPLAQAAVEAATEEAIKKTETQLADAFAVQVLEATASAMAEHYVGLAKKAAIKAALADL